MYLKSAQRSKVERFGKIITIFTIFAKNTILNLWEGSQYVSGVEYVIVLNIPKFSLIWRGSDYLSGCNNGKVLNITGFRVCQVSAYASVAKGSEYAWIWLNNVLSQGFQYDWFTFHKVLEKPPVLNMLGLRIWKGCEYARVTQSAEYLWISLNMPWKYLNMHEYE